MIRDIIINYQVTLKSPYWCKGGNTDQAISKSEQKSTSILEKRVICLCFRLAFACCSNLF